MSLPEVLLWRALKLRPGGFKFRRQHAAGRYVLDFYCDAARLAVEVDGASHDFGDQPAHDAERDAWLRAQGVEALRLPARFMLGDLDGAIRAVVTAALTPSSP